MLLNFETLTSGKKFYAVTACRPSEKVGKTKEIPARAQAHPQTIEPRLDDLNLLREKGAVGMKTDNQKEQ